MARVRSGQAQPGLWLLTGVPVEVSGIKRDFACTVHLGLRPVPVVLRPAVTLDAGGAGTYAQRAIPGCDRQPSKLWVDFARMGL